MFRAKLFFSQRYPFLVALVFLIATLGSSTTLLSQENRTEATDVEQVFLPGAGETEADLEPTFSPDWSTYKPLRLPSSIKDLSETYRSPGHFLRYDLKERSEEIVRSSDSLFGDRGDRFPTSRFTEGILPETGQFTGHPGNKNFSSLSLISDPTAGGSRLTSSSSSASVDRTANAQAP